MSYATQQDLIDRYGRDELVQLTDRDDPAGGDLDTVPIARALAAADAEINGYIASRVTTPVSPVPLILTEKACVIARYLLWKDRASERVRNDYLDSIKWLKDVAAGTVSLGDATAATAPTSGGKPQFGETCRTFTKDSLKGF
jgi:phage gp36-like protein